MNTASTSALDIGPIARPPRLLRVRDLIRDFCTLTKPEVNFLVVIATTRLTWTARLSGISRSPIRREP